MVTSTSKRCWDEDEILWIFFDHKKKILLISSNTQMQNTLTSATFSSLCQSHTESTWSLESSTEHKLLPPFWNKTWSTPSSFSCLLFQNQVINSTHLPASFVLRILQILCLKKWLKNQPILRMLRPYSLNKDVLQSVISEETATVFNVKRKLYEF